MFNCLIEIRSLSTYKLMIRNLFSALTQQPLSSLYIRSLPLFPINSFPFSTETASNVFQLMNKTVDNQTANKIFLSISTLGDKERKEAMRAFVDRVFEGKIDFNHLSNQKFRVLLKKEPGLLYEVYFIRINEATQRLDQLIKTNDSRSKKIVAKEIQDFFVICFDAIKKMEVNEAPLKEIELYKTFAHYHAEYLPNLVEPAKAKSCLIKAKDLLKGCMTKIMIEVKEILKRQKKMEESLSFEQSLNVTTSDKEKAIQIAKETNFILFEHFSECIIELVGVELQLYEMEIGVKIEDLKEQAKNPQQSEKKGEQEQNGEDGSISKLQKFQFPKSIGLMEPIIQKAVNNYVLVKQYTYQSQFYYKLKKMYFEISFENKLRKAFEETDKKEKEALMKKAGQELAQAMKDLFSEAGSCFKRIILEAEDLTMLEDHCCMLAEVKMNCFTLGEKGEEEIMKEVGMDLQNIFEQIPQPKIRKQLIQSVCKHIKDVYDINISSYLEKVPRSIRNARQPRGRTTK